MSESRRWITVSAAGGVEVVEQITHGAQSGSSARSEGSCSAGGSSSSSGSAVIRAARRLVSNASITSLGVGAATTTPAASTATPTPDG